MLVIKVAVIGIVAALIGILFKNLKSEYSLYISLAAALIIIFYSIDKIAIILDTIHRINGHIQVSGTYMIILLKIVGIAYISEFSQSICKDAGYNAIALQIETFCKLSIIVISLPVFLALLDIIEKILK